MNFFEDYWQAGEQPLSTPTGKATGSFDFWEAGEQPSVFQEVDGVPQELQTVDSFQINGTDPSPSDEAYPRDGYRLLYPNPSGRDGRGGTITVGRPRLEIEFEQLSMAAWTWWASFCGTNPSVALVSISAFDPYEPGGPAFVEFVGSGITMHNPTYEKISYNYVHGVSIRITNIH